MSHIQYNSSSVTSTMTLGHHIGRALQGGEVFAINGTLGTGKTHLIKGIAAGADAPDSSDVHSPTFVLINEYEGRLTLYHLDAYRLEDPFQLEALGFEDLLGPNTVVLIEWAERVQNILEGIDCIQLDLEHQGPTTRRITFNQAPHYVVKAVQTTISEEDAPDE